METGVNQNVRMSKIWFSLCQHKMSPIHSSDLQCHDLY